MLNRNAFASLAAFVQHLVYAESNGPLTCKSIAKLEELCESVQERGSLPFEYKTNAYELNKLLELSQGDSLIEFIKQYRSMTGQGLKETKEACDRFFVRTQK